MSDDPAQHNDGPSANSGNVGIYACYASRSPHLGYHLLLHGFPSFTSCRGCSLHGQTPAFSVLFGWRPLSLQENAALLGELELKSMLTCVSYSETKNKESSAAIQEKLHINALMTALLLRRHAGQLGVAKPPTDLQAEEEEQHKQSSYEGTRYSAAGSRHWLEKHGTGLRLAVSCCPAHFEVNCSKAGPGKC